MPNPNPIPNAFVVVAPAAVGVAPGAVPASFSVTDNAAHQTCRTPLTSISRLIFTPRITPASTFNSLEGAEEQESAWKQRARLRVKSNAAELHTTCYSPGFTLSSTFVLPLELTLNYIYVLMHIFYFCVAFAHTAHIPG